MTPIDLQKAFFNRNFFRFTGPPENWLTAIKYMTWGLEEKYRDRWEKIRSGDVFLMHSTTQSLFYKKPSSAIVGLGVVGGQFRIKDNFLWIHEIQSQENRWPLLVPFSEIYLFSELPDVATWEAPGLASNEQIANLIGMLLKRAIPTGVLAEKFPVMGSWSSVRNTLIEDLFDRAMPVLYNEFYAKEEMGTQAPELSKIKEAEDTIRYAPTLKFLDGKKVKVRKSLGERSIFERDNALLERAEENHRDVLEAAIAFFQKKGFDTWSNQHVDLLAESENRAFLIEVKSTLSSNFKSQARRAVGQLFEYEYFDIRHHLERKSKNVPVSKVLMVTKDPNDNDYPGFLNSVKIQVAWPQGTRLSVRGAVGELATLMQN